MTTSALSLIWLLAVFLGSAVVVNAILTIDRKLRDRKMVRDAACIQGVLYDAPNAHEVAEIDREVLQELARSSAVDRRTSEAVTLDDAEKLEGDMDGRKAAAESAAFVAEITERVKLYFEWTIPHVVCSTLRTVLSKELAEIAEIAKRAAKQELEDDIFHKQVEASEAAKKAKRDSLATLKATKPVSVKKKPQKRKL